MRGAREQYLADLAADARRECERYAPDPSDRYPDAADLAEFDAELREFERRGEW